MLSPIDTQNNTKSEELLTPVTALPPLPIEVYPRVLVPRKRKWEYYTTLIVISFIRSITPLSAYVQPTFALTIRIYLIIFPVIVPRLRGANRIIACLLAFYALAEASLRGTTHTWFDRSSHGRWGRKYRTIVGTLWSIGSSLWICRHRVPGTPQQEELIGTIPLR